MKKLVLNFLIILMILMMSVGSASAQDSDCEGGVCPEGVVAEQGGEEEGLTDFYSAKLRGGYVAAGVGLRNTGSGTIKIKGIPAGATVYKAFLYWNIVSKQQRTLHQQLSFKGLPITGVYIGGDHETCWAPSYYSTFSYRADVTPYVTGNGSYAVSGVASGRTDGVDPFTLSTQQAPLAQGASLVVIYSLATYPSTSIWVWDGATTVPGNAWEAWIEIGPFPAATNPVGPASTTWIVADGQSTSLDEAYVNGTAVPGLAFDGADPRAGTSFIYGNLWDTRTAWVGRYMLPGNETVKVGIESEGDCITWVAQVFSISKGTLDTDGDALLDGWEASGYDYNGDLVLDVDLPLMGASPFHKDMFVEHDWMTVDSFHEHKPSDTVLNNIAASFNAAPVTNPDGKTGIRLHNDIGQDVAGGYGGGNQVAHQDDISVDCNTLWTQFDVIKNANFVPARQDIFHYAVWAHDQCPSAGSSSGISRGIPASDFLVTLGSWGGYGSEDARTGTYMHELGHNLGLTHGGNTGDHENYKPNHLSVMNYSFQTLGVWRDGARRWDYTRMAIDALNELSLSESAGLNGSASLATYGTRYYCESSWATKDDSTADTNIDWNCNNTIQGTNVARDINASGHRSILGAVHNQWTSIIYNGGMIGLGASAAQLMSAAELQEQSCLSYEDIHAHETAVP